MASRGDQTWVQTIQCLMGLSTRLDHLKSSYYLCTVSLGINYTEDQSNWPRSNTSIIVRPKWPIINLFDEKISLGHTVITIKILSRMYHDFFILYLLLICMRSVDQLDTRHSFIYTCPVWVELVTWSVFSCMYCMQLL